MRLKDMVLDFTATEVLVFHLSIPNELLQPLSPPSPPTRESVLDVAVSLIVAAFHAMNNGVPGIRYQSRCRICHGLPGPFSGVRQTIPRRAGFHLGAPTAAATRCGSSLIGAVSW
ncbi:putative syntaxin binding protein [Trypanosoma cruzi]|nr:putative syntaxin binding protein [Trypanosoma cruzi]